MKNYGYWQIVWYFEEESNNFSLDSDDLSSDDIEVSEVKTKRDNY